MESLALPKVRQWLAHAARPVQTPPWVGRTFGYSAFAMNLCRNSFLALLALVAGPAAAQVPTHQPGAYRSASAYRRHQPQPAGTNAFFPDKRGQVVVVMPSGPATTKVRLDPDSVWGVVSDKGRTTRIFRGEEFRLEHADTLCLYSSTGNMGTMGPARYGGRTLATTHYFFSVGLTGLIFPLTTPYLREQYAASNPRFVAVLDKLKFNASLSDYDRKAGLYLVTKMYRDATPR
ncbi:hypothetical protein GCM10011495_18910 [Hymenobacter frigidus]|uniref:Uncharacterized protein n=2 Tax=Hymenobacter frigidus TaxID=1524095 RepID=A0ABQ2A6D2_9BACT|nr:hypothetical protein GCM10011495_18910 [Hymenobacter frigidus]